MIRALMERMDGHSPYLPSTTVNDKEAQPAAATTPEASGLSAPNAGSPVAPVERWLADYGDVLWRFVLGRVRSRESAEEVVQETVLAAMQAHAMFAGGSTERTWLLGIAAHKVADHLRSARRRAGHPEVNASDESAHGFADRASMFTAEGMWARRPSVWGLDAGNTAENAEMLAALRRCIDALPPAQAEAVWLRDLLDVPGDEVCKAMGISPTNLWSRMHRARAALRSCVEKSMDMRKEDTP